MRIYRHLLVCAGTGCVACGSYEIRSALVAEIAKRGLQREIEVVATGCNGFCERGPIIVVQPDDIFYQHVSVSDIPHLVEEHFINHCPVTRLMYMPPGGKEPVPRMSEIGFFKYQRLFVLRNRGRIDPENIEEYIAFDGYFAMEKALTKMTAPEIINEIIASGLRGRGGAGFPTGRKWQMCRDSTGDRKYLICNGDEGDPGAFMDRSVLEADPHSVIEGMIIGAKAIGAQKGYIYVRSEYPLAVKRIMRAIEQAEEAGLIGNDILGTGFDFHLEIVKGAGAFVCGEETALMATIEGKVGRPRPRPPYPVISGLWGRPTNINNVETWANVPQIISKGAAWFSEIGTEKSRGTKIFSLVGKINNTGLVEVPMGMTLRSIIYDIGGGIPQNKQLKAVQTGGPSGGCIPREMIDLPIDYESLTQAGSMMGSGGMIVMDEDTCMVDIAKYFLNFTQQESCGKCPPCRIGVKQMVKVLERITEGRGLATDVDQLVSIAANIKTTSLCGLGQTAPNPVLNTINYFRNEYDAHINDKRCPALVCKLLISYVIDKELCTGCVACSKSCPSKAITGKPKGTYVIDQKKCNRCGICITVCPSKFGAVKKVTPAVT
ncbi:MAG TPA: NADH-quinone oxidoreductase subunit NuoF [bacterium]